MKEASDYTSIDVAMNIVEAEENFLVLKKASEYRENRKRYRENPWEVPGGKIEEGEDVKEAALRELREETSLNLQGLEPRLERLQDHSTTQEGVEINFRPVHVQLPRLVEARPGSEEHSEAEWIDPKEFRERMTENEVKAFNRALE